MKPNEYIQKYNLLDENACADADGVAFVADLTLDFMSLAEYYREQGDWTYARFKGCVSEIRREVDRISNEINHPHPVEQFWSDFFVKTVIPAREQMFGEELRRRREDHIHFKEHLEHAARTAQQVEDERKAEVHRRFDDFYQHIHEVIGWMLGQSILLMPIESFKVLDMEIISDEQIIKKRYHELSLQYHPDRGGDSARFRDLVEAKNRCLAWAAQQVVK